MNRAEVVGINLLKREAKKPVARRIRERRPGERRPFSLGRDKAVIGVLFLVLLLGFGGYYLKLDRTIRAKERVLAKKKAELKKLERVYVRIRILEARKQELQRMVKVIETLSSGRDSVVKFFEKLEGAIPDNSWLSSYSLKGKEVQLVGYSLEDNGVADLMENLSHIKEVSYCKLKYIKEVGLAGIRVRQFALTTLLK